MLIMTQVKYNTDTFVDVEKVKKALIQKEYKSGAEGQVVKYEEASSTTWFWLLLLLLLLLLLALLTALCCLLNSCCPLFGYHYRRNRKVHSAEQQTKISHFTSGTPNSKSVGVQAFESETMYRQKPTDPSYFHTDMNNVRNRERVVFMSRQSPVRSFHSFERYNRNYDAMLVEDIGDNKEYRVLDPNRLPHQTHNEAEHDGEVNLRQSVFLKEGNAEILRLVTQAHKDQPEDDHGKNIIMQRFIEDQKNQQAENAHFQDWNRYDNVYKENVQTKRRMSPENELEQTQETKVERNNDVEDDVMKKLIELSKHTDGNGGLTMLQRDLLVTRFLVEEQKKLLNQAGDTQSLPGGTCAATQTDSTKGTQTDHFHLNQLRPPKRQVKSDNDSDSDSEMYHKKKYRIRRYQIKTPIMEETENSSEYSLRNRPTQTSNRMRLRYTSPSMSSLYMYTDDSTSSSNNKTIYRTHSHPVLRDIENDATFPYIPPCIKSRLLARRRSHVEFQSEPTRHRIREDYRQERDVKPRYMEWYKRKREERERTKKMIEEQERMKFLGKSTRKLTRKEKIETIRVEESRDDTMMETQHGTLRYEDNRDESSESVMRLKKNQQLIEKKSVFTIAYDDVATQRLKSSHATPPT